MSALLMSIFRLSKVNKFRSAAANRAEPIQGSRGSPEAEAQGSLPMVGQLDHLVSFTEDVSQ